MALLKGALASLAIVAVLAGAVVAGVVYPKLRLGVPTYGPVGDVVWLDQNWGNKERHLFHHVGQGTQTLFMPYAWFVALEQPTLALGGAGLFSDQTFLDRFGFIPDDGKTDGVTLPIGFARGLALTNPTTGMVWTNAASGAPLDGIGFTCAACHTGRLSYKGTTIAIDGGGALTDIGAFQKALGLALLYTRYVPGRFERFAERVMGPGAPAGDVQTMRGELDHILADLKTVKDSDDRVASRSIVEGIGRLDALNRIGNQVFSLDLERPQNYAATSAPVRYPHVWGSSWFDWVQYNGSIEQPMVRNAGEALGVRALVNLTGGGPLFDSTVRVDKLFDIEQMLAGTAEPHAACAPAEQAPPTTTGYRGLKAPSWPETLLPKIDRVRAERGATLYVALCQGCHLPPIDSPAFCAPGNWTAPNRFDKTFIKLPMIRIETIGTDPAQAADMQARTVEVPPALGLTSVSFGPALGQTVEKTVNRWYDTQDPPVAAAQRDAMNGYRDNGIRAPLAYRPRPLDGIWAVPPYLHNGAVPSLLALLSPVAERPTRFPLGRREFDPVTVGFTDAPVPDGFTLDTTLRGNANTGHEFADRPGAPGVIGRLLTPDERMDLVEYLKTL